MSEATRRRAALSLGLLLFLAFVPALAVLPYHSAPPPGASSAAALAGYDNTFAYLAAAGLSVLGLVAFAVCERRGLFGTVTRVDAPLADGAVPRIQPLAIAAVVAAVLLLHWPFFLARYGPYREDSYFLSVLHRMDAGQRPYADFESLYGPLMLYLPHAWSKLTGYSMTSFLSLVALMEAAVFAILAVTVQRHVAGNRARILVFLAMAPLLSNVMLGVSSNGLRRMFPVFALLLVAHKQASRGAALATGLLIGVGAAYSHEFGALALVSVLAVHGLVFLRSPSRRALAAPAIVAVVAAVTWFACCRLVLGPLMATYVEKAIFGASRFSLEACFAFWWTVNSLVTFGLLVVAIAVVGRGLGRPRSTPLASGDLLLFGALVYALLALRGGLNRVDMWHLATPMLALVPAFLFPLPRQVFVVTAPVRRVALGLIAAMAVTYTVGMAPPAEYVLSGLARGARDVFTGRSFTGEAGTRAPSIEVERTEPVARFLDVGRYLAAPERRDRPVVAYSLLWFLDKRAGFVKSTYPTDDFLLDDAMGEDVRRYLEEHEDALVLMRDDVHERLLAGLRGEEIPVARVFRPTITKQILGWLSTTEYVQGEMEQVQKELRWERTVGRWVAERYRVVARFESILVLSRD